MECNRLSIANIQEYNKSSVIFLHVLSSHSIIAIKLEYKNTQCVHDEYVHVYFIEDWGDNIHAFTC